MAKKKSGANKSLEIRNYLTKKPDAKPKEIVDAMKAKGISVNAQFVSTVKTNSKKKGLTPSPRKSVTKTSKTSKKSTWVAKSKSGDTVSVESLLKLKEVVQELGSIEEAKSALNALELLSDSK